MTRRISPFVFVVQIINSIPQRALLIAAFLLPPAAASADHEHKKESPPPTLSLRVDPSHSALGSDASDFYLRIRVKAAELKTERKPLTLALVFDRSGSMDADNKIGYLRKAGHLVADNLTPNDHVAMIAFNDEVHTLVPMHPVVNREYLHHRIDELHAEGYTNISGGLMDGVAEVRKRLDQPGPHHVILLTDGVANRGVWQTAALVNLTRRLTRDEISVTTIGVGIEYNEDLLTRMAQTGGGRYVHVSKPDDIPTAFKRELGAMLAVVAQNAKLKMKLPPGIEVKQVFGWEEPQKPGQLELPLGDVTSGEERVVLVKMHLAGVTAVSAESGLEFTAALTYDDVAAADRKQSVQHVAVQNSNGQSIETPVFAYAQLAEAVDKIALAVTSMDRKAAAEVLQIQRVRYPALKKVAWESREQEFVNKAFMFEHFAKELHELVEHGALHEHSEARAKLQKDLHYRRYLLRHHQHKH